MQPGNWQISNQKIAMILVRVSLEVLVATIRSNELQNGLHIIGAGFEYQMCQHTGAMLKNQHPDETVDK